MKKSVYLDYAATTPLDPRVLEEMLPYFNEKFGNSVSEHEWGWSASDALEKARAEVAKLLGAKPREIFFTSGATESNNWAIRGLIDQIKLREPGLMPHILISPIEHACILEACKALKNLGALELGYLPLTSHGQVDLEKTEKMIKPTTRLVAAIWVHNELGVVNPVHALGRLCRSKGVTFLSDATQAIGKFPIQLAELPIDLITFSAHKIYGPKGVGALWAKDPTCLQPLQHGGGHERGWRSGTVNIPGVVGLAAALRWAEQEREIRNTRIWALYQKLLTELGRFYGDTLYISSYPWTELISAPENSEAFFRSLNSMGQCDPETPELAKLPHISLLSCSEAKSVFSKTFIPFLGVSRGSACKNQNPNRLPVLAQLGFPEKQVKSAFRISLSHLISDEDLETTLVALKS